jgi:hypothetical protein
MEAHLLACVRRELHALDKDPDLFQGKQGLVSLLRLHQNADVLLCQVVADAV